MNYHQVLSERFYKFFKYSRSVGLISLVLFLGVSAFNTHNEILNIISYISLILTLSCFLECCILYILHIFYKNKAKVK